MHTDECGKAKILGNYLMAGVPTTGSEIEVVYKNIGAGKNSEIFPTGNVCDVLTIKELNNAKFEVTLVNAGNATVFIRAADLGLKGTELPSEIDRDKELLKKLELIRCYGAVKMYPEKKKDVQFY